MGLTAFQFAYVYVRLSLCIVKTLGQNAFVREEEKMNSKMTVMGTDN